MCSRSLVLLWPTIHNRGATANSSDCHQIYMLPTSNANSDVSIWYIGIHNCHTCVTSVWRDQLHNNDTPTKIELRIWQHPQNIDNTPNTITCRHNEKRDNGNNNNQCHNCYSGSLPFQLLRRAYFLSLCRLTASNRYQMAIPSASHKLRWAVIYQLLGC